jgi:hypothetical protein
MTPERLAEIRTQAARWAEGDLKNPTTTSVFRHRAELIVELDRLRSELDGAKDSMGAVRSWAASRLEILHHPQHLPHSSVHAAQIAVLDDLCRVLDILT